MFFIIISLKTRLFYLKPKKNYFTIKHPEIIFLYFDILNQIKIENKLKIKK